MKNIYRNMLLIVLILPCGIFAQLNLGLKTAGSIRPVVEKVLNSYDAHYRSIEGDTIDITQNSVTFNSTVKPDASLQCTLTKTFDDNTFDYSWEAVLFRSEDFNAATKKYNACCQQLKNITFRAAGETVKMEGEYEEPRGSKNFFTTVYMAKSSNEILGRVRVEVTLESDYSAWTLKVLIYDRVHDDKEGNLN